MLLRTDSLYTSIIHSSRGNGAGKKSSARLPLVVEGLGVGVALLADEQEAGAEPATVKARLCTEVEKVCVSSSRGGAKIIFAEARRVSSEDRASAAHGNVSATRRSRRSAPTARLDDGCRYAAGGLRPFHALSLLANAERVYGISRL